MKSALTRAEDTGHRASWAEFAVATIISKNYLSLARVLCTSFLNQHPGARAFVLLVDRIDGRFDPDSEPFEVIEVEKLGIPDFFDFAFKYNILELNTAVKPYFLEFLFRHRNVETLVYLDPDIWVLSPMSDAARHLDRAEILLTPHILAPIPQDGHHPNEEDILVAGAFNLGFIGLRRSENTFHFLAWWQSRLYDKCFVDVERGLFTDQKWMGLAPGLYSNVVLSKDPGYNVAYWNLHERQHLGWTADGYRLNGAPLVFYHFSGFDRRFPNRVSKYQDRFRLPDLNSAYQKLFQDYCAELDGNGWNETRKFEYHYAFFDNGAPIPPFIRRIYYSFGDDRFHFGNPFASHGDDSFFRWLLSPRKAGSILSNLSFWIYQRRADLVAAFPDPDGRDALPYHEWLTKHVKADFDLNEPYLDKFRTIAEELGQAARERQEAEERCRQAEDLARQLAAEMREAALTPRWLLDDVRPPATPFKRYISGLLGSEKYRALRRTWWNLHTRLGSAPVPETKPEVSPGPSTMTQPPTSGSPVPPNGSAPVVAAGSKRPFGVNLIGYLDTESGVGEIGRSLAAMLRTSGLPHALVNLEQSWLRRSNRILKFSSTGPYTINLVAANADQAAAVIQRYGLEKTPCTYNIGYWFWELSLFPDAFRSSFDHFDEVWVASDFCLDAISRVSPIPVVKIRPAFDPRAPGFRDRAAFGFEPKDFVFLYVFDSASILKRKNPGGVISAFRRAFSPRDPVRLVLKTIHASPHHLEALERLSGSARVHVWPNHMGRGELLDMIASCDAYVSLHRSEGLGLTLLEALMFGKPVVATDYSGVQEFLGGPNTWPVRWSAGTLMRSYGPYPAGTSWAEPDLEHAAEQMRAVYERRRVVPTTSSAYYREAFGVAQTTARLQARLASIQELLASRDLSCPSR